MSLNYGVLMSKKDEKKFISQVEAERKRISHFIVQLPPGELVLIRMAREYSGAVHIVGIVNDSAELVPKAQAGTDIRTLRFGGVFTMPEPKIDTIASIGVNLFKKWAVADNGHYGEKFKIPQTKFVLNPYHTRSTRLEVVTPANASEIEKHDPEKDKTRDELVGGGCSGGGRYEEFPNPEWKPAIIAFIGRDAITKYLEERFTATNVLKMLKAIGADSSEEMRQAARGEATEKVLELYAEFHESSAAQRALEHRVKTLQRGGVFTEGGALIGVFDKEDVFFITAGQHDQVADRLRSFLGSVKAAKESRIWEQVETVDVSPGLRINVREFIEGLERNLEPPKMEAAPQRSKVRH